MKPGANKITGASSRPALQFESRGLRRRALVVERHGRYRGGAADPGRSAEPGAICDFGGFEARVQMAAGAQLEPGRKTEFFGQAAKGRTSLQAAF
jgi:hypothetical protein